MKIILQVGILLIFLLCNVEIYSQKKLVCIGNSITYGYGLNNPSSQSYPARLQVLMGDIWKISNFGVSARTMLKKGDRPYWNEPAYADAKNLNPDLVIIMLGTNDAKLHLNWIPYKDEFEGDYKAMIKSFRELSSSPEIWICRIVPAYQEIWDISDVTIQNEVNPVILKIAIEEGVGLIDLYTVMSNKKEMFLSDGIHPNMKGANEIAKTIFEVITRSKPVIKENNSKLIAQKAFEYQWYRDGIPLTKEEGGKNQIITIQRDGEYKVSLKYSSDQETRVISESIKTNADILESINTIENAGFKH